MSNANVQITSSFDGATLSLFGTIEPDIQGVALSGPYNVVVVITGPLQDRVTRLKTDNFGIWSNTDQVNFKQFPSFYDVLASGKLDNIADRAIARAERDPPDRPGAARPRQTARPPRPSSSAPSWCG